MFGEGAGGGDAQQPTPVGGLGDLDRGLLLQAQDFDRAADQPQPAGRERQPGTGPGKQRVVEFLAQRRDVHGDSGVGKTEFRGGRPYRAQANHRRIGPKLSRGHALKPTLGSVREVLAELMAIWAAGDTAGVATVVRTLRSAPRPPGAAMVVAPDGSVSGSVSGGCVEGAVYELAAEVAQTGIPRLEHYGVSDDTAFAVGLTCGGIIDVFVEPVSRATFPELGELADDIGAQRPVAIATVIAHPDERRVGRRLVIRPDTKSPVTGSLGSARADAAVIDDARGLLAVGRSEILEYGPDGQRRGEGMEVFVSSHAPRPRMLVFGAIDFAAALARQGSFLGYRVTVCDARAVFATPARFPTADDVVVAWPHRYLAAQAEAGGIDERTVICVLTHDPKFDVPVLEVALRLGVGYVGAMGSRKTHDDRMDRLRAAGLTDAELSRLSSPIGLDLGARTPEETAVSIAADIIARRWGGGGRPLADIAGRIHHDAQVAGEFKDYLTRH